MPNETGWLYQGAIPLFATLFGGGIVLFADHLRSKRTKDERYREIIAEKSIEAYGTLMRLLIELNASISPIQYGLEPLRWPKDRRVSPNPSELDNERAKKVHNQLSELNSFVETNQMILGSEVYKTWQSYWATFKTLQIKAEINSREDIYLCDAIENLMNEYIDAIGKSIKDQLKSVGVDFVLTHEWQALRHEGIKKADALIAASKRKFDDRTKK